MSLESKSNYEQVSISRVFEEICAQIRTKVANGELRPGDKLPAERELAAELNVGRPALREALRALEVSGIVALQKGGKGGAFIREANEEVLTRSLSDFLLLRKTEVEQLVETRVLITQLVATLACERGTPEDFDRLELAIQRVENEPLMGPRSLAGLEFFRAMAAATHNEILTALMGSLGQLVRHEIDLTGREPVPELVPVRRKIVAAMRARDPVQTKIAVGEYMNAIHRGIDQALSAPEKSARAKHADRRRK